MESSCHFNFIFSPSLIYALRSAPLYVKQANQITDITKINVASSVTKAYYNLLPTLEQINVLKEDTLMLRQSVEDTYHQLAILALTLDLAPTNNVYTQIGLITLIGLSAKNAILIVEFAKLRVDRGEELIKSTMEAVRLRLRPIIMTSMASILGVLPLVFATGAGASSRNTIGVTVLGGMIASSTISIFIVPVLYVIFIRLSYGKKELAWLQEHHEELMEKAKKVEEQNIDPELEHDIAQAKKEHEESKKNMEG